MTTKLERATQLIGEMSLVIREHEQTIADLYGAYDSISDKCIGVYELVQWALRRLIK